MFVAAVMAVTVAMWTSAVLAMWLLAAVLTGLPDDETLRGIGVMSRATTVFDAHNKPAFTIFKEQRIEVPLSRVSPHIVNAVVAVEDQRFFEHGGVDIVRIGGAAWKNIRNGWGTQGGSTITQQLARQSFLTREKTVQRKLKEIVVAARLENAFSKEQILEWYLNKVYFGDGLHGVEAASLGYFGKHAADLDAAEAALLAGLIKGPSAYAPTVSMERAVTRRNTALEAMHAAGMIDAATLREGLARPIQLRDTLRGSEKYGHYFKEEVRRQLVERFGWDRVYEGGLRVYTTMDPALQQAAEAEVVRAVEEIERRQTGRTRPQNDQLQAALVALDPVTGEIRAMVGGRRFEASPFNRVTQARRQAGSAFKPFVYAAALERGYTPATLITPQTDPIMTVEGAWVPDDHSSGEPMTMRAALRESSNRAAVGMLQEIGIPTAIRAAERFGIESVPGVWSLALGSGEVSLLSMTAAYSAFANSGMRPEPILIRRVETTDGEVLFNAIPKAHRAISEATAFLMSAMLSDVLNGGTGWQARRFGFTYPAAGKTGTTNDYRDAWFIGYTPLLATGVWVGYDQPRTIIGRGYAATLAVPLWGRFMAAATRADKATPFSQPRNIVPATICRLSGKLAGEGCRSVMTFDRNGWPALQSTAYTEYFVRGTEPAEYCDWHATIQPHVHTVTAASALPQPSQPEGTQLALPMTTTGALPTVIVPPAQPQPQAQTSTQPPPQRRGFWSRLFRRGERNAPESSAPTPPVSSR